jgi:hypothetical protein
MAAFRPAQSPPLVKTPIRFILASVMPAPRRPSHGATGVRRNGNTVCGNYLV